MAELVRYLVNLAASRLIDLPEAGGAFGVFSPLTRGEILCMAMDRVRTEGTNAVIALIRLLYIHRYMS